MIRSLVLRRVLTIAGVIAVMAVGVGSIRAAAAWTASSAPLTVAPVALKDLESRLADERARSAALQSQLDAIDLRSRALGAALLQAQDRVVVDTGDADAISAQMAAASRKLAKVEAAIAKAERSLAAAQAVARRQAAAVAASSSTAARPAHEDDDDHEDEDEHAEDEDD